MRAGGEVILPAGTDVRGLFGDAWHSAWRTEPEYRRWATRLNPVLFAYTYLSHHLSSPETGGRMSLARHHVDMAAAAVRWRRPGAHRDAWVAPRGGAKTTWQFLILPLWALAHEHRRFCVAFADTESQAVKHLDDVRIELAENDLLLYDFPGLGSPRGRRTRNNGTEYVSSSGAAFMARGMGTSSLGLKRGSARPDLLVGDDLEPDEGSYSPAGKVARLSTWQNKVLPMNEQAAVSLAGTVTMHGSILHDVVRAEIGEGHPAPWIADGGWRTHYYPAITQDPATGAEVSYWETRHPLAYLQSIRHTRDYALNYSGRAPLPGGELWRENTFRYLRRPVPIEGRTVFVDVAMSGASSKARHDYTAIAILGRAVGRPEIVVEYARAWRMTFATTSQRLADICRRNPDITSVHIEVNAFGGEEAMRRVIDAPPGARLVPYRVHENKEYRIKRLLRRYEDGNVLHATRLPEFEEQAVRYPHVDHDDLVDVVAAGVEHLLPVRV
jgi:phage terminase large subunit-like protein